MQQQGDEVEVEAVQVLHKKLKFRTVQGSIFPGTLDVYECEQPYVLICKVTTEHEHSLRMDVHKDDLAAELRQWLEGKVVRNPVAFPPKRIDEAIQRFVKFGKAPLQEDLIMWILSRSELQWAPEAAFTFGGLPSPSEQAAALDLQRTATFEANAANLRENPLARTVDAALKSGAYATDSDQYRMQGAYGSEEGLSHLPPPHQLLQDPETAVAAGAGAGPPGRQQHGFGSASVHLKKAAHLRASSDGRGDNPLHMARQLIGTSAALAQLKSSHHAKGSREGAAREVLDMSSLTPYHWKLASEIEKARKEVEEVMDQRRKEIEIARARKKATQDKFSAIRKTVDSERTGGSWFKVSGCLLPTLAIVVVPSLHFTHPSSPHPLPSPPLPSPPLPPLTGGRARAQQPAPRARRHCRRPPAPTQPRAPRGAKSPLDHGPQRHWQQPGRQVGPRRGHRARAHPQQCHAPQRGPAD